VFGSPSRDRDRVNRNRKRPELNYSPSNGMQKCGMESSDSHDDAPPRVARGFSGIRHSGHCFACVDVPAPGQWNSFSFSLRDHANHLQTGLFPGQKDHPCARSAARGAPRTIPPMNHPPPHQPSATHRAAAGDAFGGVQGPQQPERRPEVQLRRLLRPLPLIPVGRSDSDGPAGRRQAYCSRDS